MNLFTKQKQIHRHREQTCGCQGEGGVGWGRTGSLGLVDVNYREGNGNPLQCSCLENPRDGGAWWAAFYGVTQMRTGLK